MFRKLPPAWRGDPKRRAVSKGHKAASIPVYLFWAVSGVTLAKEQMVTRLMIPAAN
jgi:hypothetical protein